MNFNVVSHDIPVALEAAAVKCSVFECDSQPSRCCGGGHVLRQNAMLRWTTHVFSRRPTPDPGFCECYIFPLSYLGGVARMAL